MHRGVKAVVADAPSPAAADTFAHNTLSSVATAVSDAKRVRGGRLCTHTYLGRSAA